MDASAEDSLYGMTDWPCVPSAEDLRKVFIDFASFGSRQAFADMDGAKFFKLAKDTRLVTKAFTVIDVDIIFAKASDVATAVHGICILAQVGSCNLDASQVPVTLHLHPGSPCQAAIYCPLSVQVACSPNIADVQSASRRC